jgi:hypothetical protein
MARSLLLCSWVLLGACSGSGDAGGVSTLPTTITAASAALVPSSSGLGRVADVPEEACPESRASATLPAEATPTACHTDADCTEGRNGRCLRLSNHGPHGPSLEASTCSYDACFRDADCDGPRGACYCGGRTPTTAGAGHSCITGECATDADCGQGRYCRRGPNGRTCHSPADRCVEETACGSGLSCTRGPDGVYDCVPFIAPEG